jgi:ABC-type nickel/cobalt efflux system permease component RcnA
VTISISLVLILGVAVWLMHRYVGRQVWNKQRKDEVLIDVHDVALGHTTRQRWNETDKWIYSEQIAHPLSSTKTPSPRPRPC